MGVPAFFKWLVEKYPKTVQDMLERRQSVVDGVAIPLNLNEANPNGVEYDNLYIDMNGLIHPCSHPEDRDAPTSEYEMYVNVTKYVDRLFAGIRPRRLLFLAIDGVAPRAKMNQQRSRRFRSAQEAKERQEALQEVMEEMRIMGIASPQSKGPEWDSNVITPGTDFMSGLSTYLRFYILDRMNKDPAWRNIEVILSDASVPGEGEHKVMAFIRHQRTQPGYDPNQRHVLHGLDADLIMLALATHEAHFTILREEVTFGGRGRNTTKSDAQRLLEEMNNKEGAAISSLYPEDEWVYGKPLQRLNIAVLRDYLVGEFGSLSVDGLLPFGYDLERVIDDFVFLCFFVGNDFLPHLPSLDIRDGAIDFLIETYKDLLPSMGGYITSPGGVVNLSQVDIILGRVGQVEDIVFQRKKGREDAEAAKKARNTYRRKSGGYDKSSGETLRQQINSGTVSANSSFANKDIDKIVILPIGAPPPPRAPPPAAVAVASYGADSNANAAQLLRAKFNSGGANAFPSDTGMDVNTTSAEPPAPVLLGKRDNSDMSVCMDEEGGQAEVEFGGPAKVQKQKELTDATSQAQAATVAMSEEDLLGAPEMMEDDDDGDVGDEAIGRDVEVATDDLEEKRKGLMSHYRQFMHGDSNREAGDIVKARLKSKQNEMIEKQKLLVKDDIKLHESGWKDRYYGDNFKKEDLKQGGGLKEMCFHYIKGLCWVFKYYYEGCVSWNWFYPFHYAPFASDLLNVDSFDITFELSQPFHPFEQLLSVLPSESSHCLPEACSWLMTDRESPIIDIYNSDIPIDPNGKPLPWLWVLLIPFIDESRVRAAMAKCAENLTEEETRRNSWGPMLMFLHRENKVAVHALSRIEYTPMVGAPVYLTGDEKIDAALREKEGVAETTVEEIDGISPSEESEKLEAKSDSEIYFSCEVGNGICGLLVEPPASWYSPLDAVISAPSRPLGVYMDIPLNCVLTLVYRGPPVNPHASKLLAGVVRDESVLTSQDLISRRTRVGRNQVNILDVSQATRTAEQRYGTDHSALGPSTRVEYDQYGRPRPSSFTSGLATNQPFFQQGGQGGGQGYGGGPPRREEGGYNSYGGRGGDYQRDYQRSPAEYGGRDGDRRPAGGGGYSGYSGGSYGGNAGGGYDSWDQSGRNPGYGGGSAAAPPARGGYGGYQYSGYDASQRSRSPDRATYYGSGGGGGVRQQYPPAAQPHAYPSSVGGNNGRYSGGFSHSAPTSGGYGSRSDERGGSQFSHHANLSSRPGGSAGYSGYGGASQAPASRMEYSGSRNQQMYGNSGGRAPPPPDRGAADNLSTFSARNTAQIPSTMTGLASQLRGPELTAPPPSAPAAPTRQSRDPRLRR